MTDLLYFVHFCPKVLKVMNNQDPYEHSHHPGARDAWHSSAGCSLQETWLRGRRGWIPAALAKPGTWQKALDHQRGHFAPICRMVPGGLRWLCRKFCEKDPDGGPTVDPLNQSTQLRRHLLKAPWVVPKLRTLQREAALKP